MNYFISKASFLYFTFLISTFLFLLSIYSTYSDAF